MDLKQLRYFVACAEEGNMGRAARRLFVVQSALSRQVQELEREVGAPLLERYSRGVRLTPVGAVFLEHARHAVAAADEALRVARAAVRGEAGRLRVALPDYGERARQAAAALERFRAARPEVEIELAPLPWVEHRARLLAGEIDVGFAVGAAAVAYPEGVRAEALGPEPLRSAMLPAAHPLARRRGLTLAELAPLPMVLSERAPIPVLYDAILAAVRRGGYEPKVLTAPGSFASVVQLVAGGAGWVAVLDSVRQNPPAGTVVRPVRDLRADLEFHVLRRPGAAEALAADFVRCLLQVAAE